MVKEIKNKKNNTSTAIATLICGLTYIFLVIFYVSLLHRRNIIKDPGAAFKLSGNFVSDISSPIFNKTAFYVMGDEKKELLKVLAVIGIYTVCIFYSIKEMKAIEVAILLPFIFILTLPMMIKHVFKMYSMPTEEPFVVFLLLVLTGNLWYLFSKGGNVIDADSKSISVNMSIIFVFLYIIFKRYYGHSTSESLMKSIMLTGASGVFIASAPIYTYKQGRN